MNTLLLDQVIWDLCLDAYGNIAVASNPYAIAQDASSAIRLFQGELWFNTTPGVPYFQRVLGKAPPAPFLKAKFEAAALSVPEVKKVKCYLKSIINRKVTGQVQIIDIYNQTAQVGF